MLEVAQLLSKKFLDQAVLINRSIGDSITTGEYVYESNFNSDRLRCTG